jgi:hypothetical protein
MLALLLCGALSLAAQSRLDASIYVAPVTGRGSKPDDNTLFFKKLLYELTDQRIIIANTQKDAEYSLMGTVGPRGGQFVFHLLLQNNRTNEIKVEGELLYLTPDDTDQLFSVLVTSMVYTIPADAVPLATIPEEPVTPATVPEEPVTPATVPAELVTPEIVTPDLGQPEPVKDDWRNKWLYLGLGAKWTPGLSYTGTAQSPLTAGVGIQVGFSAEFHFLNFMSLEVGVEGQTEKVKVAGSAGDILIGIPVLIKLCFKPGANSMLEPYAVGYVNFLQFKKNITPPLFSAGIGLQYSVKAGPGAVFFDARGVMDLGKFKVKGSSTSYGPRINAHIGLGYKFGLIQRETK